MLSIQTLRSERLQRLFKEGFWVVFGQMLAVLGALVGVRILTEMLEPAAYGELALGMTLATMFNQTMIGPLSNGITRFYASAVEQGDLGNYLKAVRRLVFSATGIIILFMCVGLAALLVFGQNQWIAIVIAALIFAILSGYNSILNGIQNAARQRIVVALHRALESWGRYLVAAGLMLWLGATSSVALLGYSLAVFFVLMSQSIFFRRKIINSNNNHTKVWRGISDHKSQIFEYSWPFATWGIILWVYLSSGMWSLQFFGSTKDVGHLAVLLQLGYYPVTMMTGMATQFIAPIYFQRAGDATNRDRLASVFVIARRITMLSVIGTFLLAVMALLFHVEIFSYLTASSYRGVSELMPLLVIAAGLLASAQFCTLAMQSQKTTRSLILPKNVSYALGAIITTIGAVQYGLVGVIYATIATSVFHLVWVVTIFEKQNRLLK